MARKEATPISMDIDPIGKKTAPEKKLGLRSRRILTRKMVSMRLRPATINDINSLVEKLRKRAKIKYSQSAVIELALMWANRADIVELIDLYADTFRLREQ